MKVAILLILVLAHGVANAEQATAQPHEHNKLRGIGGHDERIDTEAKCKAKGGRWGGTISGRGRSPGCNLPTTDAGKPCTNKTQCQGSCVPKERMTPPCVCDRWMSQPKGFQIRCTDKGVQALEVD